LLVAPIKKRRGEGGHPVRLKGQGKVQLRARASEKEKKIPAAPKCDEKACLCARAKKKGFSPSADREGKRKGRG